MTPCNRACLQPALDRHVCVRSEASLLRSVLVLSHAWLAGWLAQQGPKRNASLPHKLAETGDRAGNSPVQSNPGLALGISCHGEGHKEEFLRAGALFLEEIPPRPRLNPG